jgi:hypothetical protein
LWQKFQILQGSVSHLAGECGTVLLQLIAQIVGSTWGLAAAQRHAVEPLVVRLEHDDDSVHCAASRQQLEITHHTGKTSNLLDQRLGRPRTERNTERGHGRTHRPAELGNVPDGLLGNGIRLAPGFAGLVQGDRDLLSRCSGLLQLGLDL